MPPRRSVPRINDSVLISRVPTVKIRRAILGDKRLSRKISMTMRRRRFWLLAVVFVGTGVVTGAFVGRLLSPCHNDVRMAAMWAHNYPSLGEMRSAVDVVVLATLAGSRPGRTIRTSNGQNVLPFTLVDPEVEEVIQGDVADVINMSLGAGAFSGSCDSDSAAGEGSAQASCACPCHPRQGRLVAKLVKHGTTGRARGG